MNIALELLSLLSLIILTYVLVSMLRYLRTQSVIDPLSRLSCVRICYYAAGDFHVHYS